MLGSRMTLANVKWQLLQETRKDWQKQAVELYLADGFDAAGGCDV